MIKNHFKIAWRNLLKHKKSAGINIGGLAIGMAVAILIGLWLWDELSFDRYNKNNERVAQVLQHQTLNGETFTAKSIPYPLGDELRTSYGNNFKYLAMASWGGSHLLKYGEKNLTQDGIFIDKDGPSIFSANMVKGTKDGLKDPNAVLLSASAARAFFGDDDPINKVVKIDNRLDVKVAGVYEDFPYNTELRGWNFMATWELYITSESWIKENTGNWDNNSFQLFAQISDNTDFATVNKHIREAKLKKVNPGEKKFNAQIFVHPMTDWHLRSNWKNGWQKGGLIEYVWMFGIIGVFVLLLACINFMNLSTARSERRAKEVGIRKTVGSARTQLIGQFLSESILVSLLAFFISLVLVQLTLPWFNQVAGKRMILPLANAWFWVACAGFALLTGLIAGSYPALYLSSFRPIKVLKGTFRVHRFAALPRQVLVVLQFTVSVALIIGTIVVYRQIQYSKDRPVGYDRSSLLMIEMRSPDFYGKSDILRQELKSKGVIKELAESSSPLTDVWSNNGGYVWEGKDPNLNSDFAAIWVTPEFGKTVGWTFKEGRDFSRDFITDSNALVINEAAVTFMGLKNPVGTRIRNSYDPEARVYTVIGVINDMLMQSPYEPVKQSFYMISRGNSNWINIKLNPDKSVASSLATVESVFKKVIPGVPFEYKFADTDFATKFDAENRVGKLATFFTLLAIFISCLGLFGLASFVAEQRTKEIGIRKIVGASVFTLWKLLSKDFVMLVIIACLIAIPLTWYYLNGWLQQYEYRVSIAWWIFIAATAGAVVITLLTVSFQAIKAAVANPVKALRSE